MAYDYSKLNGRIVEVCGTRRAFAKIMGMTEASISKKLHGKTPWKQQEMQKAMVILEIPVKCVADYFFASLVKNS